MFSTYLAAGAVLIALCALYIAAQATNYAKQCTEWMQEHNEKSAVIAKLTEFEAEMTMHADLINALRDSMKKLRSRIHMRNLNTDRPSDGPPDPNKDPQAWKAYMNAQLVNGERSNDQ